MTEISMLFGLLSISLPIIERSENNAGFKVFGMIHLFLDKKSGLNIGSKNKKKALYLLAKEVNQFKQEMKTHNFASYGDIDIYQLPMNLDGYCVECVN